MNNTGRKQTSWGWIIFWFIFFWPIGLVLLIKREKSDKQATLNSNRGVFIASFILMGIGVSGLASSSFAGFLFLIGGVAIFLHARKVKKTGDRYKNYITLIVNHNHTSIEKIANLAGVSYDVALSDLQNMINDGYFQGAYIDTAQGIIVLSQIPVQNQFQPEMAVNHVHTQPQRMAISCNSCGASAVIVVGQPSQCEYCDSFLQMG